MSREVEGSPVVAQFVDLVTQEFAFLTERGFETVVRSPRLVAFESRSVALSVGLGWGLNDVQVSLGRIPRQRVLLRRRGTTAYSLPEVVEAVAPSHDALRLRAGSVAYLRKVLHEIADILRYHAAPLLAGDDAAFDALDRSAAPGRAAGTLRATYGATRDRGDAAWDAGDRALAADFYEAALPHLDATRQRRLVYIRRRTSKETA